MADVRVEFGNLGDGYQADNVVHGVIKSLVGQPQRVSVSGSASDQIPFPAGARYAFVTAISGNVIAHPNGGSEDASQTTASKLVLEGNERAISREAGVSLSLIELAAS